MDLAHHKNRVRRKNSSSFLEGEEILAAFLLPPSGAAMHRTLSTAIGQIAGAATGAAAGASAGSVVDHSLETTLEEDFDAAEKKSEAQPHADVTLLPEGTLFVITDRRYLIFRIEPSYVRIRYSFVAALPLSAIIDMQLTLGVFANKVRLAFADGTSVLRDLPYGQGKHRNLIKAFARVREQAFPSHTPLAQQVADEQGGQETSPKSPTPPVSVRPEPPPLPSPLRSIPYAIGRALVPVGAGVVTLILLLLLILLHLYHPDSPGDGSSPARAPVPAWVSRANSYCRTVIDPALSRSGILTAKIPADYARAVPAAAEIDYQMSQYLLSMPLPGSAPPDVLSMSIDWDQVAKYEWAAAIAYDAGNSAGFKNAVNVANSWATDINLTANSLGLYACARTG
jgi:hypothetical protein